MNSYNSVPKTYIEKALKKYGLGNFKFEIILTACKEELSQIEKYLIAYYNSNRREIGYNLTEGGEGTSGHKMTQEQRQNMSNARKNISHKISGKNNPFYGKKHSLETIAKIIESNKRRKRINK